MEMSASQFQKCLEVESIHHQYWPLYYVTRLKCIITECLHTENIAVYFSLDPGGEGQQRDLASHLEYFTQHIATQTRF